MDTYAVIDIGTLKVKFLIAKIVAKEELLILYESSTLTCFGCDMENNEGNVLDKNLNKTIEELNRCRKLIRSYGVDKYRVVSTHAMRKAKNKEAILTEIKNKVGFEVVNISQEEEAKLFFEAVIRSLTIKDDFILIDVGGGSVQLLIGNNKKLKNIHLMQTGTSILHENFTKKSENKESFTTQLEIEQMKKYILQQLLPMSKKKGLPIVYGSLNIIDLIENIAIPVDKIDNSPMHPYRIYAKHLENFIKEILPLSYAKREEKFNFQKGYMWGIDKAFINVVTIAKYFDSPYIIPTNANVAKGLIYTLALSRT